MAAPPPPPPPAADPADAEDAAYLEALQARAKKLMEEAEKLEAD